MNDQLYRMAFEKMPNEILAGLDSNAYQIFNGVVRKVDNYAIVKHIPLEPVYFDQANQAKDLLSTAQQLQRASAGIQVAMALSTVAVMGAIVVATAYLAKKIDKLQTEIAKVHKELNDQNIVFYTNKISRYFGQVESLREICAKQQTLEENKDYVLILLAQTSAERNQLLSFMSALLHAVDSFSTEHKNIAIDFLTTSLDMIPKGAFIETQAAYKIERFSLGESVRLGTKNKHEAAIDMYKKWANENYRKIVSGSHRCSNIEEFKLKMEGVKQLVQGSENRLMLEHSI